MVIKPEVQNPLLPRSMTFLILSIFLDSETEHHSHAKELAKSVELSKYDGIVCVSGDGVLTEVCHLTIVVCIYFDILSDLISSSSDDDSNGR